MSFSGLYVVRLVLLGGALEATEIGCIALITNRFHTTVDALFSKPFLVLLPWLVPSILAAFAVYWAGVHLLERRAATELALLPAGINLGIGIAAGVILFASVFGALAIEGSVIYQGYNGLARLAASALIFAAGVAFEELIFRGVILRIAEESIGTAASLLLSALLFAASHIGNAGVTFVGAATLVAGGISLGLAYVLSRNLWLPIGAHLGWNFAMGALFGTAVSGHVASGVLRFSLSGAEWVTGGRFGPESSIYSLCFLVLLAIAMGRLACHRSHWVPRRLRMRQSLTETASTFV